MKTLVPMGSIGELMHHPERKYNLWEMSLTPYSHMFQIMQGLSVSLIKPEESNKEAGSSTQFILKQLLNIFYCVI